MPNRLQFEKSPYLLQHAQNPVDWFAWGEEAFLKAKTEHKPIFLSIGYATCHWCHVMEHESFEDPEIAALMNQTFVNIKVDREERPDIDGIYMTVCQMMTGHGGWPLTVLLTPDQKPFFAATYIPKDSRGGRMGMRDFIPRIAEAWANDQARLGNTADYIVEKLQEATHRTAEGEPLDEADLLEAYRLLTEKYDPVHGGFGNRPKFPTPHNLMLLLREWKRTDNPYALQMVEDSLQAMRLGGIFDHLGFGFHRYSTDRAWFLPHFEKMLYDQALLAMAYTETYQATQNPLYAETAHEILAYVLRDMTDAQGGFYAAEDADSEGEEGRFYVWSLEELTALATEAEQKLLEVFQVTEGGNYYEEATGEPMGTNILHLKRPLRPEEKPIWEGLRKRLLETRRQRIHPLKDDKVLTDWNGLMMAAFAKAAQAFDRPDYAEVSERAAAFIRQHLTQADGRLLHRWRQDEAGLQANLDDYAFYIWGLIELYQATFEPAYLAEAVALNDRQTRAFWDEETGGYFFTPADGEALILREKQLYDSALPSGNAVSFFNQIRLARLTGRTDLELAAEAMRRVFADEVRRYAGGYTFFMLAATWLIEGGQEVVLLGEPMDGTFQAMRKALGAAFLPHTVILAKTEAHQSLLTQTAPYTAAYALKASQTTAYVCENFACQQPTNDLATMMKSLKL